MDGDPHRVVVKISSIPHDPLLLQEEKALTFLRGQTQFPVPRAYGCCSPSEPIGACYLVLEWLPGRNLGKAKLTPRGCELIQEELARYAAHLHSHHRPANGALGDGAQSADWVSLFSPRLEYELQAVGHLLKPESRRFVERLIGDLTRFLNSVGTPTLVHGDLWNANILVDDRDALRPRITGFVDAPYAEFADVEYELAYLQLFETASPAFFVAYERNAASHGDPVLREGYERRFPVYWLRTMMLHVRYFGVAYLQRCEKIVGMLQRLS